MILETFECNSRGVFVWAESTPRKQTNRKSFSILFRRFRFRIRICPSHSMCVHFSSQNQFPTIIIDSIRTSFTRYEGKKGRKRMRFISLVLALVPVQFKEKSLWARTKRSFFVLRENKNEVMWLCLDTTCKIFYNFSSARIIDGKLELVVRLGGPHRTCWCSPSLVSFICLFHPHGPTYCPTLSTISRIFAQWTLNEENGIIYHPLFLAEFAPESNENVSVICSKLKIILFVENPMRNSKVKTFEVNARMVNWNETEIWSRGPFQIRE